MVVVLAWMAWQVAGSSRGVVGLCVAELLVARVDALDAGRVLLVVAVVVLLVVESGRRPVCWALASQRDTGRIGPPLVWLAGCLDDSRIAPLGAGPASAPFAPLVAVLYLVMPLVL